MSRRILPIIVIDDDPDDLFFTTRLINKVDPKNPLLVFSDSSQALKFFENARNGTGAPASIVFCDLKMPTHDGFEVLRRVRASANCSEVPFVVLSGSDLEVDIDKAKKLGATKYLTKFPSAVVFHDLISSFT